MAASALSGDDGRVANHLGTPGAAVPPTPGAQPRRGRRPSSVSGAASPGVPAAVRSSPPGWRDPRLWVGVAIVAASVLVGVRVLAAADESVAVWAVAADVGAGDRLGEADLVTTRVRFTDGEALERYFTVEDTLPEDLRLLRGLAAGELLPRAALAA